jgi:chaperonin GroES
VQAPYVVFGRLAQLAEQLTLNQRVTGSNPVSPIRNPCSTGVFEESESVFLYRHGCRMGKNNKIESKPLEIIEPIGKRVLIRKDEDKKQTKGGIQLPDNIEIPTITGRVITISAEVENSPDIPLRQYDKVLFNPKGAIPVDFEGDNRLFVVEVENVVAVFRKS